MKKVLILLVLLIFTACGNDIKKFEKREFTLLNLHKEYGITMSYDGDKIYGFSGVNRYFGIFKVEENKVEISNVAMTKMAGDPEAMKAEQEYLDLLSKVKNLEIKDNTLFFYTSNGEKLEFVFSEKK